MPEAPLMPTIRRGFIRGWYQLRCKVSISAAFGWFGSATASGASRSSRASMGVFRHLEAFDYVRQRWKNGGGTTTELAREDAGDRWLWRVSIADVEVSGPFSDFAGYRRIIALLDGNGMALSFDRAPPVIIDRPHEPFAFDGGWRTD